MKISVPYGASEFVVDVPTQNLLGIFTQNKVAYKNTHSLLTTAIKKPMYSEPLKEFISDARDILFIVNDCARATPTAEILDSIYNEIKDKEIRFLIATGTHRSPTIDELNLIFGNLYAEYKDRIFIHDSKRDEDMVYVGRTQRGTPVWINKLVFHSHKIIPINSVEPHYFAGYTGGRKSFVPGVAFYETVKQNHKLALSPLAEPLALSGNPVHEDMTEATHLLKSKSIFSIQTVLDGEQGVYYAAAGNIFASFEACISYAQEVFCVKIPEKSDIVVTVASPPFDASLYQSHKALEHARFALKEGGILILVSSCREGIGPMEWFELISSCNSPQEVIDKAQTSYEFGYHTTAKLAELANTNEIWGITELEDNLMCKAFIKPFHDLQVAIDEATKTKGTNAKLLFLMDGALTVPMVGK